jgi:hypothetical protein
MRKATEMKRFKYQALVTLAPQSSGQQIALPGPGSACRMVVRARDHETGRSRLFPALVSGGQGTPPGHSQMLVTVVLADDDAGDCLAPGDHFTLWRGGPASDGVVTRRLFI